MKKISRFGIALAFAAALAVGGMAGCAGNQHERSTGEYIDDKALNARVKGALGDDKEHKFPDVEVQTFKGTVQLSGFVNTKEQKERAGEVAKTVAGVTEVVNNITVKPSQ